MRYLLAIISYLFLCNGIISAQQPGGRIEILHADDLQAQRINNEDVQKLKGSVIFRQNDVTMNCDSAILYGVRDVLNAFGHVFINQHDSVHLYGDQLDYDGKTKYAIIRQNVKMTDRQMTLLADRLDYDFSKKEAFYTTGGHIIDAENKLTSRIGYYFSETRDMYFKKDVVLTNPQFVIKCDTLQYNIVTRKAIFHGPTTITSDKSLVYCESGWYNTETNKSQFGKNAYMKSEGQVLSGDSLYYERNRAFGKAVNNVKVTDTTEKLLITGQYAEYYQKEKKTFITNQVLVTKGMKEDSIYMSSDTIFSTYDSIGVHRIIKGYYHAKIYNRQFQAICDSLIYSGVDSTIDLRTRPVMWFGLYQATAKRILMHTKNNKITQADLYQDAFLVSEEDTMRYSQIKGRNMVAYFRNSEMHRIDVNGNSEAMYYVKDDKKAYIGLNHITSSDIKIDVKDRKISRINFIKEPDATLTPMKDAKPEESKLPGFVWHGKQRPLGIEDIKRPRDPEPVKPVNQPPQKKTGKQGKKKK
jgi:lipopolysaccharide export system protein LptA